MVLSATKATMLSCVWQSGVSRTVFAVDWKTYYGVLLNWKRYKMLRVAVGQLCQGQGGVGWRRGQSLITLMRSLYS